MKAISIARHIDEAHLPNRVRGALNMWSQLFPPRYVSSNQSLCLKTVGPFSIARQAEYHGSMHSILPSVN